ncbi:hypothetical protein BDV27DRAFT_133141 [Aspergillus caelatus]|uniref:Uncharacterized protein n=1 Tax=Aspergillus caelatus TaxID=61420 RepID=A0A5N6ZUW8_9EURO|nr:uncharacterized protein BDV27DRAFT_133141 [Aspergillus caelatus]KAE8361411.1 hypothetical protein BDV27DRAFT_133141 [Aspergillus caelatus]
MCTDTDSAGAASWIGKLWAFQAVVCRLLGWTCLVLFLALLGGVAGRWVFIRLGVVVMGGCDWRR